MDIRKKALAFVMNQTIRWSGGSDKSPIIINYWISGWNARLIFDQNPAFRYPSGTERLRQYLGVAWVG